MQRLSFPTARAIKRPTGPCTFGLLPEESKAGPEAGGKRQG